MLTQPIRMNSDFGLLCLNDGCQKVKLRETDRALDISYVNPLFSRDAYIGSYRTKLHEQNVLGCALFAQAGTLVLRCQS